MRTRRPATGPVDRVRNGVRFLAPTDGEQGGSWISINEHGLTLGLLNHYPTGFRLVPGNRPSRGQLILDLADSQSSRELTNAMGGMALNSYPPFRLIGVDRHGAILMTWNGIGLQTTPSGHLRPPVTSSSWQTAAVERHRIEHFESAVGSAGGGIGGLESYHHEHSKVRPAESVLMCRPDACTHSIVRIDVGLTAASMRYEPQPWIDQVVDPVEVSLALRT